MKLGVMLVALGGCTHSITDGFPGSSVTFHRPGSLPPAARTPVVAGAAAPAPRNGRYAGTGRLIFNPGARSACRDTIPITGFTVNGDRVSFSGFRGPIDSDGSIQMQAGRRWISGHFIGADFEGRLWQPPPACTYALSLTPVG